MIWTRNPIEQYLLHNRNRILSWILVAFAIYFLLYLILRNQSDSIIPTPIIVCFLIACILTIFYLQFGYAINEYYGDNDIRIKQQGYSKVFQDARRDRVKRDLRQELQQGPITNYAQGYPYIFPPYDWQPVVPLGSVLRTGDIVYRTQTRYLPRNEVSFEQKNKEFEAQQKSIEYGRKNTQYNRGGRRYEQFGSHQRDLSNGLDSKFSPSEIMNEKKSKWNTPLEIQSKSRLFQGDEREYEAISSNTKALEQYEAMGIKLKLPIWVENIRYWMSNVFIPMILARHQQNIEKFNKLLSLCYRQLVFYRTPSDPTRKIDPILWEDLYDSVIKHDSFNFQISGTLGFTLMNDAEFKNNIRKLVEERETLEKYFRLREDSLSKREYVIERLKQLQSKLVDEYKNNGGMDWNYEPWNTGLPRDSDVSFTIYLDYFMAIFQDANATFLWPRIKTF